MSKEGVMKTFTIHVDFDGRREDGEFIDGRKLQAKDEDEAWEKFNKQFYLEHFGTGYRIEEEEEDESS